MYPTSKCRINVSAVGPHNFDAAFVDLQEVSVAGLETKYHQRFIRNPTKQLLTLLNDVARGTYKMCRVEGPPGTGKSSTVWAWACSISTHSVRWVHLAIFGGGCSLVDLKQSKIVGRASGCDFQTAIIDCTSEILILDGITDAKALEIESVGNWMRALPTRRVIVVSSLNLRIKPEAILYEKGTSFFMPSWTIDEYKKALEKEDFRQIVESKLGDGENLTEKIMNKYFLAGGSARWMFDFTPEEVLYVIDEKIKEVGDYSLLTRGFSGRCTPLICISHYSRNAQRHHN